MHDQTPSGMEALLAEELTPGEVRDLLERLNARDMGGSESATVAAVVEATNSDPLMVGRLLAEIRKEDFEQRFGLRIDHHEDRIDALEERTRQIAGALTPPVIRPRPRLSSKAEEREQAAVRKLAEEERRREEMKPVAVLFAVMALTVLAILAFGQCDKPTTSNWEPATSVGTVNGGWIKNGPNGLYVEDKNGATRRPTDDEVSVYYSITSNSTIRR